MIRVTKTEETSRTLITIDGQLSGESIGAVDTCCSQADLDRKPVYLFLRDVTTVDQAGITLLRHWASKGVHLLARGVYTSYLVEALSKGDAAEQSSLTSTEHLGSKATRGT
jgi:ABC-type transporter Mla MlaB component